MDIQIFSTQSSMSFDFPLNTSVEGNGPQIDKAPPRLRQRGSRVNYAEFIEFDDLEEHSARPEAEDEEQGDFATSDHGPAYFAAVDDYSTDDDDLSYIHPTNSQQRDIMAPQGQLGKRVKGVQVRRPFVFGSTARPFDEKSNPKPAGVPDGHTHSWSVFIRGIDDTDITYWLRRVHVKLHDTYVPAMRILDGEKGKPFVVHETGWGEFEITFKLYYVTESGEKPQTLYHHLRLHPWGKTDDERAKSLRSNGDIVSWNYEEQLFNEPYEPFFNTLTSGAHLKGHAPPDAGSGKGKGKGKMKSAAPLPDPSSGIVLERSALIPKNMSDKSPFSKETEQMELDMLARALAKAEELARKTRDENTKKEQLLADLKAENMNAG